MILIYVNLNFYPICDSEHLQVVDKMLVTNALEKLWSRSRGIRV